jgi:hypothetical protein
MLFPSYGKITGSKGGGQAGAKAVFFAFPINKLALK